MKFLHRLAVLLALLAAAVLPVSAQWASILSGSNVGYLFSKSGGAAALYSLQGSKSDATYQCDSSSPPKISLIADRSGNSSTNCLVLNGVTYNYAWAPSSAALQITGDIDLRCQIMLSSWSSQPNNPSLISKDDVSTSRDYTFYINSSGRFVFLTSTNGSSTRAATSQNATGLAAYSVSWCRVTYEASSGHVNFYISPDGISWSTLGAQQTIASGAIHAGTYQLELGATEQNNGNMAGVMYRACVYNSIASGTTNTGPISNAYLVFDADFSRVAKLLPQFTEFNPNNAQATVTIASTGATGARIAGERDLVQLVAASEPLLLAYAGTKYSYNNGTAGYTLTTPTQTITGNTTLTFDLALSSYAPASNVTLFDKLSGNNGIRVLLLTTGVVRLVVGDGSAATNVDSTSACSITAGARGTLAIAWTDGVGATFTQNGSTPLGTVGSVHTLTNAAVTATVGPWTGSIYSVTVASAVATLTCNPNASYSSGATWTATTGEVWTINGGACVVGQNCAYFNGTSSYMASAPFSYAQPESIYATFSLLNSGTTPTYQDVFDGGTYNTGALFVVGADTPTKPLRLYAGSNATSGFSNTKATQNLCASAFVFNGASSSGKVNLTAPITVNVTPGANNMNGLTLGSGAGTGSSQYTNILVSELLLRSAADSAATQAQIANYQISKWKIVTP